MVIFKKLYFFNTIKKKNKLGSTNITRKKQQREEKRIIHGLNMKTEGLDRKNISKDKFKINLFILIGG